MYDQGRKKRRSPMRKIFRLLLLVCFVPALAWPQSILIAGGIDNSTVNGTHLGLTSSELYNSSSESFAASGPMNFGRTGHAATLLQNGNVLVTGGDGDLTGAPIASAELYSSVAGTFTSAGNMTTARVGHTAVLLANGSVLIAGGQNSTWVNQSTAELYNPKTGTFTATRRMTAARTGHTATLLKNGMVLIAGGGNAKAIVATAELYNPLTRAFTATSSMATPRQFATATLLQNGQVLITGGGSWTATCSGCSVNSAEIYDPTTGMFSTVGSMTYSRRSHTGTLLADGNVLITGGWEDTTGGIVDLNTAEIFDATSLSFSSTSNMNDSRADHRATQLCDGNVLITGGFDGPVHLTNTAEVFDASTGAFQTVSFMTDARGEHTATRLSNSCP
jgi:hypothetical protein